MPATSSESKALMGVRSTVMLRALYPNSAATFGDDYMTTMRAEVSPRWPGLVKSFSITPNSEAIVTHGMSGLEETDRHNPDAVNQGLESYDWDMTVVPQVSSTSEKPYYSHKYLAALAFGTSGLVTNSATAADNYQTTGTGSGGELPYVGLYRVMLNTAGTTLGARAETVIGKISDWELSCSVGEEVMVSVSGPAVSYSTGISEYFGDAAGHTYATPVATAPLLWNDLKIEIAGVTQTNIRALSLKKTQTVNTQHRHTSNATTMNQPWCLSDGKMGWEVKLTADFETYEQLNALLAGTNQDIHILVGADDAYKFDEVLWTTGPVSSDVDTDDLIGVELTGTGIGGYIL